VGLRTDSWPVALFAAAVTAVAILGDTVFGWTWSDPGPVQLAIGATVALVAVALLVRSRSVDVGRILH